MGKTRQTAPTVLVVEDDPALRRFVESVLRADGLSVESVADGRAALEALQRSPWDLVVMDLMLPELSGYDLLEALADTGRKARVVMMSARAFPEDRAQAIELGAVDYLVKPFRAGELCRVVRRSLRTEQEEHDGRH